MNFVELDRSPFSYLFDFGVLSEVKIVIEVREDDICELKVGDKVVKKNNLLLQIWRKLLGFMSELYLLKMVNFSYYKPEIGLQYNVKALELRKIVIQNSIEFLVFLQFCSNWFTLINAVVPSLCKMNRIFFFIFTYYHLKSFKTFCSRIRTPVSQTKNIYWHATIAAEITQFTNFYHHILQNHKY